MTILYPSYGLEPAFLATFPKSGLPRRIAKSVNLVSESSDVVVAKCVPMTPDEAEQQGRPAGRAGNMPLAAAFSWPRLGPVPTVPASYFGFAFSRTRHALSVPVLGAPRKQATRGDNQTSAYQGAPGRGHAARRRRRRNPSKKRATKP